VRLSPIDLIVCIKALGYKIPLTTLQLLGWKGIFLPKTGFPATRVHLTKSKFLDFEEPSTRCSFTDKVTLI